MIEHPPSHHPLLALAVRAATAAAGVIRAAAADPGKHQIRQKQPNDFVTEVDIASEQVIVDILLADHPGHCVRGEESAQKHGNPRSDHVWIVDPLDGTTNFIHGYPQYSVSIALAVRGRIEHGVVLDVSADALFCASRGQGATCNGQRLRVSERAGLDGALLATSCPPRLAPDFARSVEMLGVVMGRVAAIRRSGSAALDLARVAAGQCDGSFDQGLSAWDVAAGSLLVEEAGGRVGNFLGAPDYLETRECMTGAPAVFDAMRDVLAPYSRCARSLKG